MIKSLQEALSVDVRLQGKHPYRSVEPIPELPNHPPLRLRGNSPEILPSSNSVNEVHEVQSSALPWHWRLEELNLKWEIAGLEIILAEKRLRLQAVQAASIARQKSQMASEGKIKKVARGISGRAQVPVVPMTQEEAKASIVKEYEITLEDLEEFLKKD